MVSKKNPHADLEGKKSIFFLLGAAFSLLLIIFVFQYKTEAIKHYEHERLEVDFETVSIDIPPTLTLPKPKPITKAKVNPNQIPSPELEIFELEMGEEPFIETSSNEDSIISPIDTDPFDEEPEVIDIYGADKIALPFECSQLADKTQRMDCFNVWIAQQIKSHLKYPERELVIRNEGKVYLSFEISEKGKLGNIKVLRGVSPGLDAEAIRVVSKIPKISPAIKDGRPAIMTMKIPVIFKIN